jgi:hypothetical protein
MRFEFSASARRCSRRCLEVESSNRAIEEITEIQLLAAQYALAVDSRDLETLADLFVSDVRVGRDQSGREALRMWYELSLATVGATIHFIGGHTVDLARRTGVVYCREEVLNLSSNAWSAGMLQYWDIYRRENDRWLFESRKVHRWYRPVRLEVDSTQPWERSDGRLPDDFPTWPGTTTREIR